MNEKQDKGANNYHHSAAIFEIIVELINLISIYSNYLPPKNRRTILE